MSRISSSQLSLSSSCTQSLNSIQMTLPSSQFLPSSSSRTNSTRISLGPDSGGLKEVFWIVENVFGQFGNEGVTDRTRLGLSQDGHNCGQNIGHTKKTSII